MRKKILRLGTRKSQLALLQSREVAEEIERVHPSVKVEFVSIVTKGDKILDSPLSPSQGKGFFVKEIDLALLSKEIDVAVHSLKDIPTEIPDGIALSAVTRRGTPFDVLISSNGMILDDLPPSSRIGTSSLRRKAQLLNYRPDLDVVDLRGNLDTRLSKLKPGELDGIVLSAAGVERMGWQEKVAEVFTTEVIVPAVGQGCLGVECRADDKEMICLIKFLEDETSRVEISAERAFLTELGGGCQIPAGALARIDGKEVSLEGMVATKDGRELFKDKTYGRWGEEKEIAKRLIDKLLSDGAEGVFNDMVKGRKRK